MPDYETLYFKMFGAASDAINILIKAQRECEEIYVTSPETNITFLPQPKPEDEQ